MFVFIVMPITMVQIAIHTVLGGMIVEDTTGVMTVQEIKSVYQAGQDKTVLLVSYLIV